MSRRRALLSNKGVTPSSHGSGTQNDPFLIFTVDDLLMMRNVLAQEDTRLHSDYYGVHVNYAATGQYFKLMADLDLSSICGPGIGNFFGTGDGQLYTTLAGDFDGNNHTISNMYDYYSTIGQSDWAKRCGLFYQIIAGGRCHHLILSNVTAYGRYGGCISEVCRGTVDHCKVLSGSVSGWQCFGGITGWFGDGAIVEYCENSANIIRSSWGHYYPCMGGIVGIIGGTGGTVRYCINFADINVTNSSSYHVGGIVGSSISATNATEYIENNINLGNFHSSATLNGGIVGHGIKGYIQANMMCGVMTSSNGQCGAILGYKDNSGTLYVYGNLSVGIIASTSSTNIYPINYSGTNNASYPNYFITEFNKYTGTKTGVVASTSSDLICTADNTRPSAITNTTFWTTDNFVFKQGYYPYPRGIENEDAYLCAAAPVVLIQSGNTYANITGDIDLGNQYTAADGITWTSSNPSVMSVEPFGDYYIGKYNSAGTVTITNWRNGKAYKRMTLTLV